MRENMIRIDTLHNMLSTKQADDRGFHELVDHGYEHDMKEMYGVCYQSYADICNPDMVEKEMIVSNAKRKKEVCMAWWGGGRLYDSADIYAYEFPDVEGLWIIARDHKNAEWLI